MSEIKEKLKEVVEVTMIPEVEEYIADLHKLIENNEATEDNVNEVKEMESFLVELQNIVLAVEEDKIDDEQATEVYENILNLIEESQQEMEES